MKLFDITTNGLLRGPKDQFERKKKENPSKKRNFRFSPNRVVDFDFSNFNFDVPKPMCMPYTCMQPITCHTSFEGKFIQLSNEVYTNWTSRSKVIDKNQVSCFCAPCSSNTEKVIERQR